MRHVQLLIFCALLLCFLSSCSSTKINYSQRGFHAFSSRDTILLSFHELSEELQEFAFRHSANKILCPVVLYAHGKVVDDLLFSKGVILSIMNEYDSITLKRLGCVLNASHFVNCIVAHDSDLNNIELYSKEDDQSNDWTKIRFNVYDLKKGICIEQVTIKVNRRATVFSDEKGSKVVQVHRSSLSMFIKGYKNGIARLFKNCR